ncbi:MAG: DNA adenine methylase [Betaproteobacteria bacterium]|nr:DNA adenine methylase [Betaproteobacteria bacterium]
MQITQDVKRSALRYFGGKWAIAPWIIEHMPEHRVYVEPFGGAASVLLRKPRSKIEVYNDLDEEIVSLFRILQDPVQYRELFRRLCRTPYARREFMLAFKSTPDPIIRAQRAIIRAYMSFHHTALFNPKKCTFADARHRHGGHAKSHEWSTYPRHLASVCRRLSGVLIECRDALDVIRVQDTHDALFFVDPPYVHSTRRKGTNYRHELDDARHIELLTLLKGIKGKVMISGYASELYDDILSGWQRHTRKHYAAASGPKERTEVLWIK